MQFFKFDSMRNSASVRYVLVFACRRDFVLVRMIKLFLTIVVMCCVDSDRYVRADPVADTQTQTYNETFIFGAVINIVDEGGTSYGDWVVSGNLATTLVDTPGVAQPPDDGTYTWVKSVTPVKSTYSAKSKGDGFVRAQRTNTLFGYSKWTVVDNALPILTPGTHDLNIYTYYWVAQPIAADTIPVPEPATYTLALLGVSCLFVRRYIQRRARVTCQTGKKG